MSHSTPDEDRITLTPVRRPDPVARDRTRRRKIIAGVIGLVVIAGGGIGWAVSAGGDDAKPVKHTAVLPQSFGAYTASKPGASEWAGLQNANTDPDKGRAHASYSAAGGKGLLITVYLDPAFSEEPGDTNDALSAIFGTKVDSTSVKEYDAGSVGGKILCADIKTADTAFSQCAWNDKTANITLTPVHDHRTVVSPDAPTDLRAFLEALKISKK